MDMHKICTYLHGMYGFILQSIIPIHFPNLFAKKFYYLDSTNTIFTIIHTNPVFVY